MEFSNQNFVLISYFVHAYYTPISKLTYESQRSSNSIMRQNQNMHEEILVWAKRTELRGRITGLLKYFWVSPHLPYPEGSLLVYLTTLYQLQWLYSV
jgi:hypothetical protein